METAVTVTISGGMLAKMPQVPFASCSSLVSRSCAKIHQPRQDGKQQAPEIQQSREWYAVL